MADAPPPDLKSGAGKRRGGTSGKVADFRYKRPAQPEHKRRDARPGSIAPLPAAMRARGPRRQAYAALDLGTNNCRLLIARPSGENFTVIDAFSRVVRLGEGLAASGRLSDVAMDRALAALHVCAEKLRRRNVHLARSVATEACRRAANGERFIERVREETGIVLDIISAQEEARLAVLGCHILLEDGKGPAVIFDIGGGSTELVLIEPGGPVPRILDWMSVPWGVVSLTDSVQGPDGTAEGRAARYAAMRDIVDTTFTGLAPMAVSPESMTALEPSQTALATSETSARVGSGLLIMVSSIWVAVIAGRPNAMHCRMISF